MDKDEEMIDAMVTDTVNDCVNKAVKHAVTKRTIEIIVEAVNDMLKNDSAVSALKETAKVAVVNSLNPKIEVVVNERIEKAVGEALTKAALQAELEMAKNVSNTRAAVVKKLEDYLELRSREFEDFNSLLDQTAIDNGEDGLGAGGPHTTNLNIAYEMNDKGDEILKQVIEHLQADLPGEAEIDEIEAGLAKMTAEEELVKDKVVKEEVVRDGH